MATLTTSYQYLAQTYLGSSYGDLYVRIYAKYSEQDIANNRTKVQYQARTYFSGNYIKDNQGSGGVSGTSASYASGSCTYPTKGETTIATTEAWVYHESNGAKSVTASASLNFPNWGWSGTASATATLPTIPRQATIKSAPDFNDEGNPTITYSNPAGSAATSLKACISWTGGADIAYRDISKTGTSYTFNLTDVEREALRKATTGSNSRTVTFYVTTVIGGTTFYSTLQKTFTVINATPTLEPSVIDINEDTIALTGNPNILVRYQSNADVSTGAEVYKNATIKSQRVICGNQSISGKSGTIEDVSSGAFIFSVTDNRENTVTQTVNVPFIEYVNLTCNLNAGAPDAETGDMAFSVSGNCFSGSFGATDNAVRVYYRYKANNDDYCEWIEAENVILNNNTYVAEVNLSGLDYQSRYTFQAMSSDTLMEILSIEKIVKTVPVFDWGEHDFNFNVNVTMSGIDIHEYVNEKNFGFITGYVSSAVAVAAYDDIPFVAKNVSGSYFTLENGIITVGKDVSCVRVSAVIGGAGSNGRCWAHLKHNDTSSVNAIQYGEFVSPYLMDILPVNEGDTISVYTSEEFTARSGAVSCYIYVERLK